ncbi:MAG: Zn-ribbon domain-containing OB-fold protein [Planctomycetes bacterium]|nr:Zn-ribbon domain-containing OB-fold protein [Planctomycetota bacterium]
MFGWFGKISFVPFSKVQDFAVHLKDGRLMGSVCKGCGYATFPPRADCPQCLAGEFDFREIGGRGKLYTWTRISAAPTGFEDVVPYTLGVVDLEEGGRLVAWIGDTIPEGEIRIGMGVQVVPRMMEEREEIKVYYTIEKPGTTWGKAPPSG